MPAGGPLALLGALVAGIFAGDRLGPGPAHGALVVGAATAVVAFAVRGRAGIVLGMAGIAALGGAVTQRAHDGLAHSPLTAAVDARDRATITGALVDDPDGTRFTARVRVRVDEITAGNAPGSEGVPGGGRTVFVTAGGDAGSRLRLLSAGDRVELDGWLSPLAGADRRLRWRHAVGRFDAVELVSFREPSSPLLRVANGLRALVLRGGHHLPSTDRAVLAGFLLGDTRGVPYTVEAEFRAAGLTHLLAVSGANVAFVLALVAPALRRLGLRGRLTTGLAVLVVFGTMTRWEPSVLRACAMAACSMTALYLGRPAAGLRVLALAAIALLLADPFLLHSIGFLLSCGASAGITLLAARLSVRLPGPAWARAGLGVTLAAQIGVAPVILPVFGSLPLVALPANLVAVPLAAPLTVWGLVSGVAGGIVGRGWPGLAGALQVPTLLLVRAVLAVAAVAGRVPLAVDDRAAWAIVAVAALVAARRRRSTLRRDGLVPAR
ncbi:MAG: ComEC/Rec2 family competence protein [Acidimicrobiia bacterium]